jgi:hypothetical protein
MEAHNKGGSVDTTLTKTQFAMLDKIAGKRPDARVIAWHPKIRGPILRMDGLFWTIDRDVKQLISVPAFFVLALKTGRI